jgi:hypothetical protein
MKWCYIFEVKRCGWGVREADLFHVNGAGWGSGSLIPKRSPARPLLGSCTVVIHCQSFYTADGTSYHFSLSRNRVAAVLLRGLGVKGGDLHLVLKK